MGGLLPADGRGARAASTGVNAAKPTKTTKAITSFWNVEFFMTPKIGGAAGFSQLKNPKMFFGEFCHGARRSTQFLLGVFFLPLFSLGQGGDGEAKWDHTCPRRGRPVNRTGVVLPENQSPIAAPADFRRGRLRSPEICASLLIRGSILGPDQ